MQNCVLMILKAIRIKAKDKVNELCTEGGGNAPKGIFLTTEEEDESLHVIG